MASITSKIFKAIKRLKSPKQNIYQRSISFNTLSNEETNSTKKLVRAKSVQELRTSRENRSEQTIAIEELVQCGICFEKLLQPRMLPCQHTFCLNCLEGYLISSTKKLMRKKNVPPSQDEIVTIIGKIEIDLCCPTCKTSLSINKGFQSLKQLPRNVYIDSLLKLLSNSTDTSPSQKTTYSKMSCISCQTLAELPVKKCKHCKQVFCQICWTEHLYILKANLKTLKQHIDESENRLQHRMEDFIGRCVKLNDGINKLAEEKVSEIKAREKENLKQLEKIKQHELFIAKQLQGRLENIKKELEHFDYELLKNDEDKVTTFMNFHSATSKLLNDVSRWGETRIVFNPKTFEVTHNHPFVERGTPDNKSKIIRSTSIKNILEDFDSTATYYRTKIFKPKLVWSKCPRPASVAIPPWATNLLYIAATDTKMVLIMDRNTSKVIDRLFNSAMLCPHGLTFSKKNLEVYVSDKWKHCIHVFSSDGDYLRCFGGLGSGPGELRSPEGIAINQRNELVVCDVGNDRVLVLNPTDGRQLFVIGMINNRTQLHSPTDVAVRENKIFILDHGNNQVKVFTTSGEELLKFGSLGNNNGQFKTAEVITVDSMGFILVGDAGNARIQVFRPDGKLVRIFGGYGDAAGKFSWISGLTVTEEFEIIVTDYKSRRLQIF